MMIDNIRRDAIHGVRTTILIVILALIAFGSITVAQPVAFFPANGPSYDPSLSADGRYVAYMSQAYNLVSGDEIGGYADVFVTDRIEGVITRVSVASDGTPANADSSNPMISSNGRYVAFESNATNLDPRDINGWPDVFVHDLHTGTTELVSIATDGARGNVGSSQPSISGDGRYVAFVSTATTLVERDTNNVDDVFVHDRDTGETVRIGGGDGPSYNPVISDDGAYVAFISDASNLVRDNENNPPNVFIAPREGRGVELVSVSVPIGEVIYNSSWGYDHVALTRDGRAVVFTSNNDFLVGENIEGNWHVFLRDLDRAVTEQMSLPVNANCSYCSGATSASVSGNGRYVVFEANYPQMLRDEVAQDTQLYMYDRAEGAAMRVSVATDGSMINDSVQDGVIARDGGFIAYRTEANNIVPGDLNGFPDIFVYDRNTRTTELVSARRAE